jgi:hypothetical protein
MGIIQWWNDKWNKAEEAAQETPKETVQDKPVLSDVDRVTNYFAKGGEIVDLSNKPRKDHDGFPPDQELLTPFNRAHTGTRDGIAGMVGRKR